MFEVYKRREEFFYLEELSEALFVQPVTEVLYVDIGELSDPLTHLLDALSPSEELPDVDFLVVQQHAIHLVIETVVNVELLLSRILTTHRVKDCCKRHKNLMILTWNARQRLSLSCKVQKILGNIQYQLFSAKVEIHDEGATDTKPGVFKLE